MSLVSVPGVWAEAIAQEIKMEKVYRVVDNGTVILTTTDKVKAALAVMGLANKYEDKQTWFWCDEDKLS